MEMIIDVLADALADCLKMLPFLFTAFLLIEGFGALFDEIDKKGTGRCKIKQVRLWGTLVGCVPQCGFSVMAF